MDIEQREFSQEFVVKPLIIRPARRRLQRHRRHASTRGSSRSSAPLDVLQSIDAVRGIPTEEISITDERADVQRTVQARAAAGVRMQQGTPTP